MPYYQINSQYVFMTHMRERLAKKSALAHKDAFFRASMALDARKQAEGDDLIHRWLESIANSDPDTFLQEWVRIELSGNEAKDNIWDILFDYCEISGGAKLADIRGDPNRIHDDYFNNNITRPMGRIFGLDAFGPRRWFQRSAMRVIVDTDKVRLVSGRLDDLCVETESMTLHCGKILTAA